MSLFTANTFSEPLRSISFQEINQLISDPLGELRDRTDSLLAVRSLDETAFQRMKARLPFFIGATFREGNRKADHFEQIDWLILDFDAIGTGNELQRIKDHLREDPTVALAFISPSANGLKVLFKLGYPITHSKLYADGYERYARRWAAEKNLEEYLDVKTHDVTRVCFLSHDPRPIFNGNALPMPMTSFEAVQREIPFDIGTSAEETRPESSDTDLLREIRQKLSPPHRQARGPRALPFVPDELRETGKRIVEAGKGIDLTIELTDIQYGLQVRASIGQHWAQLNVFYGKQGYSIVPTPRKGSTGELAEILKELVGQIVYQSPDLSRFRALLLQRGLHNN